MTYTESVRQHINRKFLTYKKQNQEYVDLYAKDIHQEMGFTKRYPIVCNAMQQMMSGRDEYLSETDSHQSSTIIIRYYLDGK